MLKANFATYLSSNSTNYGGFEFTEKYVLNGSDQWVLISWPKQRSSINIVYSKVEYLTREQSWIVRFIAFTVGLVFFEIHSQGQCCLLPKIAD